jgi:TolA-binding protein
MVLMTCPAVATASAQELRPGARSDRQVPEGLNFAHGLLRQRKFELAAEEYQRFLDTRPLRQDADEARFGLASARLFQGRYKEARQAFQTFLEQSPEHPRARTAWYRLGELSYMLGDLTEARKALETFVSGTGKHPNLETAWTYLGDVRFGLDDLKGARTAYERSLADFPQGQLADRSRYGLGRSLDGLGEPDSALRVLTQLSRQGSTDWVDRAWFQIGRIQLSQARYPAAIESFETLDRVNPRSGLKSEAALLRAEALSHVNRGAEAEKLLGHLIAEGGEVLAPRAALALATLKLDRGDAGPALTILDEAVSRFPRSPLVPALQFRSAETLEKLKQTKEARKRFLEIAETEPRDPWADDATARAAKLALEEGDHAAAIALAKTFPQRFPRSPLEMEVRLIEARALRAGGRPKDAVQRLESLLGLEKGSMDTGKSAGSVAFSPQMATAARYELALAYRAAGQTAQADAVLASLAGSSHDKIGADAQFLLGQELVEKGRFADAIGPITAYLNSTPEGDVRDHALAHLANAQLGLGKGDEAWKTLKRLADQFPGSQALLLTRLRLAEAALEAGEAARAEGQFRLVLEAAPVSGQSAKPSGKRSTTPVDPALRGRALVGLGRALWKEGKPGEAAPCFAEFLTRFPGDSTVRSVALDHAGALEAAGQTDAALAAYRQLAAGDPKTREALQAELASARLLGRTGRPGEAAALFGGLLAAREQEAVLDSLGARRDALLAERGWALVDDGKIAQADDLFKELLTRYPQSPRVVDARFNLAESASQSRHHAEVLRLLSPLLASPGPAQATSPGSISDTTSTRILPLAYYRLGRTQIELGDWAGAETTLARLRREFPTSSRNREARMLEAEASLRLEHWTAAESILAALESEPPGKGDPAGFASLVRLRHVQSLLGVKRWSDALVQAEALKRKSPAGDPAIAELDFARGRALLGLGRPDEARAALQAVIDARKGGDLAAQAHVMRGETYFHQDRFREALGEFLKVDILYDVPRWQAAALLEAGKVYERLAQWSDAIETYERLRERFPDDPRAAEAKGRLEAVRKHGSAPKESSSKLF